MLCEIIRTFLLIPGKSHVRNIAAFYLFLPFNQEAQR
jgi:hypothetical protein